MIFYDYLIIFIMIFYIIYEFYNKINEQIIYNNKINEQIINKIDKYIKDNNTKIYEYINKIYEYINNFIDEYIKINEYIKDNNNKINEQINKIYNTINEQIKDNNNKINKQIENNNTKIYDKINEAIYESKDCYHNTIIEQIKVNDIIYKEIINKIDEYIEYNNNKIDEYIKNNDNKIDEQIKGNNNNPKILKTFLNNDKEPIYSLYDDDKHFIWYPNLKFNESDFIILQNIKEITLFINIKFFPNRIILNLIYKKIININILNIYFYKDSCGGYRILISDEIMHNNFYNDAPLYGHLYSQRNNKTVRQILTSNNISVNFKL